MIDRENWSGAKPISDHFPYSSFTCTRVSLLPRFGESRNTPTTMRRQWRWETDPDRSCHALIAALVTMRVTIWRATRRRRRRRLLRRGPDRRQCHFHVSFTFCQIATFTVYAAELTFWRGTTELLSLPAAASSRRGTGGVSAASQRDRAWESTRNLNPFEILTLFTNF